MKIVLEPRLFLIVLCSSQIGAEYNDNSSICHLAIWMSYSAGTENTS